MKEFAHTAGATKVTLATRVAVVDLVVLANTDTNPHTLTLHDSADIDVDPRPVFELVAAPGWTINYHPPIPIDFLVGLAVEQDNANLFSFVRYEVK